MAPTLESLGIDKMTVPDRIDLVEAIWDSIAAEPKEFDLPEWHRELLNEEIKAFEANPTEGSCWEEVKRRLQGQN